MHRRFRPALLSFFLRRLRNHAEAEDLTQEVFIRLARSGAEIETADAYVFQTAANLLRDRARAERTRSEYRLSVGALRPGVQIDDLDPSRVLLGREQLGNLVAALRELPDRTRAIFILYRLEAVSRVEIARSHGISVSAVEKHLARAMAHLAVRMEGEP
ncbi:MAG: sigma-70 family RNA polymerase sigma factor [Proteobacteria bacterium]|nr:sigma-70 family RNA polymerase sigma factor [Pseudomonadota bacterium]